MRQATTKPTTANAAENQTGSEALLASMFCRVRIASGGSAAIIARTRPPSTAADRGEASREPLDRPAAGCSARIDQTLRPDRSGNVTASTPSAPPAPATRRPAKA
ncbi:MAG TPA: hypothetical protein VME19_02820 [Streptosporangiaceae bacterium]|nr:hypothetical protein [Streptosporangiaceae bacterium]